jgi:5-methylcytosine-specific restriction protein B
MRQEHAEDLYVLYDLFIDTFLFKGNSILSDHEVILNQESRTSCIDRYINNYDDGVEKFDDKIQIQFSEAPINTKLVFAHAEWLWAYSVYDISQEKKKHYTLRTTGLPDEELNQEVYPRGFGSAGQWHTNNKYHEIKFNLLLIDFIRNKINNNEITTVEQAKKWIEHICLFLAYEEESEDYKIPQSFKETLPEDKLSVTNILPYNGNPDKYERIASGSHKNQLYNSFKGLLSEEQRNDDSLNLDQKIYAIREVLGELTSPDFDFYDKKFLKIWNYSLSEEGFDEVQGLQYKKAIILYGPPGTSKTYTAKSLSKALITNAFLKDKSNVAKYFREDRDITEGKIHHLQLHPNYTYEDFVIGYHLQNNQTEVTPGILFSICEAAKKDKGTTPIDDVPHVLILDEINRIDLSRLFGEVFSAIENREQPIRLGIGDHELTIPRNLYIIGTMNEIDFSLEQIDFALQRRFLWYFYGFDAAILKSIIEHKDSELKTRLKLDTEVEKFIANAEKLNTKISSIPELGRQYQIGHTFFGEIVDIYKSYKEIGGYKSLQKQIYRREGPASILWAISLEPMLKSFLGNMEPDESNRILKELNTLYFSK